MDKCVTTLPFLLQLECDCVYCTYTGNVLIDQLAKKWYNMEYDEDGKIVRFFFCHVTPLI